MPPAIATATANGLWVSDPIPDDNAAGRRPRQAISAVISIAVSPSTAPSTTASVLFSPPLRIQDLLEHDHAVLYRDTSNGDKYDSRRYR